MVDQQSSVYSIGGQQDSEEEDYPQEVVDKQSLVYPIGEQQDPEEDSEEEEPEEEEWTQDDVDAQVVLAASCITSCLCFSLCARIVSVPACKAQDQQTS